MVTNKSILKYLKQPLPILAIEMGKLTDVEVVKVKSAKLLKRTISKIKIEQVGEGMKDADFKKALISAIEKQPTLALKRGYIELKDDE